jgi:hypothetical protein
MGNQQLEGLKNPKNSHMTYFSIGIVTKGQ